MHASLRATAKILSTYALLSTAAQAPVELTSCLAQALSQQLSLLAQTATVGPQRQVRPALLLELLERYQRQPSMLVEVCRSPERQARRTNHTAAERLQKHQATEWSIQRP